MLIQVGGVSANKRCEMANVTSSFNVHKTINKRDTEPLPPRHSWSPVTFSPPPVAEMTGRRKKGLKGFLIWSLQL